jgi:hypothetical protein
MIWETPAFIELRMDSEIGSYQDDFDRDEGPLFLERGEDDDAVAA